MDEGQDVAAAGTAGENDTAEAQSSMLPPLGRDAILGADDIQVQWVAVPEWKGSVLVKGMSGRQLSAFQDSLMEEKKNGERKSSLMDFHAKLAAMCIVYPDSHDRMFSAADVAKLSQRSGAALMRVCEVAQKLSGMTKADVDSLVADLKNDPGAASS